MDGDIVVIVAILVLLVGVFAPVLLYARRYKKVPPDKAMVVYGRRQAGKKGYQVITGGAKFIWPIVESYEFLPLGIRTLDVNVDEIVTDILRSGAKVNIEAVAQVKVSSDPATLDTAAEHLLHKTDPEINEIAMKTLEGHVRGVCATLTLEQINSDRDAISSQVPDDGGRRPEEHGHRDPLIRHQGD